MDGDVFEFSEDRPEGGWEGQGINGSIVFKDAMPVDCIVWRSDRKLGCGMGPCCSDQLNDATELMATGNTGAVSNEMNDLPKSVLAENMLHWSCESTENRAAVPDIGVYPSQPTGRDLLYKADTMHTKQKRRITTQDTAALFVEAGRTRHS